MRWSVVGALAPVFTVAFGAWVLLQTLVGVVVRTDQVQRELHGELSPELVHRDLPHFGMSGFLMVTVPVLLLIGVALVVQMVMELRGSGGGRGVRLLPPVAVAVALLVLQVAFAPGWGTVGLGVLTVGAAVAQSMTHRSEAAAEAAA